MTFFITRDFIDFSRTSITIIITLLGYNESLISSRVLLIYPSSTITSLVGLGRCASPEKLLPYYYDSISDLPRYPRGIKVSTTEGICGAKPFS